jgi:GT2 family glycosyltransferase/glycosyltransferase involved in cell wall biosynthesis
MRLLLVHHAWPPEGIGGSEIYAGALARRLAQAHEVTVLHRSADPRRPDHDLVESRQGSLRVFSSNNLHRDVAGFESYRDPVAAAVAGRVMDEVRPELVHVGHLIGLSTGLVFEARRRGVPVVLTLHDFWTLCPLGQLLNVRLEVCPGPTPERCLGCVGAQVATAPAAARVIGRRLPMGVSLGRTLGRLGSSGAERIGFRLEEMRELLRSVDVLIAPSRFLRDRMAALGVDGVEVLASGHEELVALQRLPDPAGRIRFGFIGAAIPSKGVHVLAEAFRRLGDSRASLAIHGPFVPYHGDTTYEARVRSVLGHAASDALRGPFAHEQLGAILAGIDVLVVPSLWEENAPLTVEEAFQARLPLIVSDHGGLAERVREGIDGLRFRPGDAADLARAMRRFIEEPSLLAQLGQTPPALPTLDEHVTTLEGLYARARRRFRERVGRVGVVVLDRGRPEDAAAAAVSAVDEAVAPQVLVVENGPGPEPDLPPGVGVLHLRQNRGYAGGMNAGIAHLRAAGCDRILLLNNDAALAPGALRRLAEALDDPALAAVGPVVLRQSDGRVESRGARFDLRWGRQRLSGHGERADTREGRLMVESLPGAALMMSAAALDLVGPLDEDYFHSFEDADWCVRARRAGLGLAVVLGASARHGGGRTLGAASPERLYYAARNHLRAAERLLPLSGLASWSRRAAIVALNLGHALRQSQVPRAQGVRAVLRGASDFWRGRFGPRTS